MILSSLKKEEKIIRSKYYIKKMTEDFINYYRENISKKSTQIIKGVNEFSCLGKITKN